MTNPSQEQDDARRKGPQQVTNRPAKGVADERVVGADTDRSVLELQTAHRVTELQVEIRRLVEQLARVTTVVAPASGSTGTPAERKEVKEAQASYDAIERALERPEPRWVLPTTTAASSRADVSQPSS